MQPLLFASGSDGLGARGSEPRADVGQERARRPTAGERVTRPRPSDLEGGPGGEFGRVTEPKMAAHGIRGNPWAIAPTYVPEANSLRNVPLYAQRWRIRPVFRPGVPRSRVTDGYDR